MDSCVFDQQVTIATAEKCQKSALVSTFVGNETIDIWRTSKYVNATSYNSHLAVRYSRLNVYHFENMYEYNKTKRVMAMFCSSGTQNSDQFDSVRDHEIIMTWTKFRHDHVTELYMSYRENTLNRYICIMHEK